MSGIPVFSAGTSLKSSGVSVSAQIPADSAGMLPLFVRVTATAAGYFRLSQDGASAAIGDLLIQPSDGLILKTCGLSQFSFVSQSGASTVTVTPIDVGGIKYPANIFTPAALFTTGVNGAWYDPSDFSTMFQDAAGTVPVTAVGQPVGRILDKSGRGNHAFNPSGNSANFPVLQARYNLLTKTEDFSDAVWAFANTGTGTGTKTANYGIAPDGTQTAARVQLSVGVLTDRAYFYQGIAAPALATQRWYIKTNDGSTKTITMAGVGTKQIIVTGSWQLFTSSDSVFVGANPGLILGNSTPTDLSADLLVWHPDFRVSNDALNQPAYQRVNTATDYDTVGFKPYLSFNGVNQWLQTNSIDFTYGDKMFVSAGVRKLSDAATGVVCEFGTDTATVNGSFRMNSPGAGGVDRYSWISRGSSPSSAVASPTDYPAPITNVLSGIGNISGDQAILRVNGTQAAIGTADQGTGNYGNYPMYIGARAGTSLWFNGRLYGLVVAGKSASASEIASTEAWLNQKTGAY